jgi:subtilisin family serine protease
MVASGLKTYFVVLLLVSLPLMPVLGIPAAPERDNEDIVKDRLDRLPHVTSDPGGASATAVERPWWETTGMDLDRNKVFDTLEPWLEEGRPAAIFVDLDHDPGPQDVAMLEALGLQVAGVYDHVDAIGVFSATPEQVKRITTLPGVVMVEPSGVPVINMDVAMPNIKARESDLYSPWTAWESGYSGSGVVITVMDTGQDNAHPGLAGKWVGGVDVSKPETPIWPRDGTFNADDTNGHGTTCAGIATGTGAPDGTYMGAAPDAKLVDLRIGTMVGYAPGEGPQSFYDATIQGTSWAIQFHDHEWNGQSEEFYGFEILSLSWGNDVGGSSDGKDVYSRGIDQLGETGVIPIVAAGNAGPNNDGFAGLGAADMAITIAATDDDDTITRDDDFIAEYSSRGPRKDDGDDNVYEELKPDIAAPGTHIMGVQFDRTGDGSGNGYGNRGSGTSYATPVVAGVVALMLEANGNLTLDLVREILHFTSERRGDASFPDIDPFWNKDFGWGIIDAYNATRVAANITDIDEIDTNLQAFIMNISTDVHDDKVLVEGIAWSKNDMVEQVEVSVDGGPWKMAKDMANDTWAKWVFYIPKEGLEKGNHTVKARAVTGQKHSLEHEMTFWSTEVYVPPGMEISPGILGGVAALVLAVVILAYLYKTKKLDKILKRGR